MGSFVIPERFTFNFNTAFAILPSFIANKQHEDGDSAVALLTNKLVSIFKTHCSGRLQNTQRLEQILSFASRLVTLEASNKTSLICEFLSDVKFYGYILRWLIKKLGANVHYAFHKVDGGVERTHIKISSTN